MPLQLASTDNVYQMKVSMREIKPQIWRRIQVSGNITLPRLHQVLQAVMGWTNSHLHMFTIDGIDYGWPDPDFPDYDATVDERRKRLNKLVLRKNDKFVYTYDLGDNWEHDVLVEGISPLEPGKHYPVCVEGRRACPPEDVGGIWGYRDFLKSIRNPRDPEHDEWLTWVGGHFDPEAFDVDAVNRMLSGSRLRYWYGR